MRMRALLLLCILTLSSLAWAAHGLDVQRHAGFHVDTSGKLSISRAAEVDYFRLPRRVLYPGYTGAAYWLRILPPGGDWLLEVESPLLDYVDVYLPDGQGAYRQLAGGDSRAFGSSATGHRHPAFAIPAEVTGPVYMRIASDGSMRIPLRLWRPDEFHAKSGLDELGNGLYFGILIALAIYTLIKHFMLRDRHHLNYAAFLGVLVLHQAAAYGYGQQYLWPEDIWLANHAHPLLLGLTVSLAARFTGEFLTLARLAPRLLWPVRLLQWSGLGLMASGIFGPARATALAGDALVLILATTCLALGLYRAWQRYRPAYWFSAAWGLLLLGLVVEEWALAGYIPEAWPSAHAARLAILALALSLAMALSERVAGVRIDKLISLAEANKHLRHLSAGLKTQVRDRTTKLRSANKQLAEKNRILADIASHDGLTGLLNHASFMSLLRAQVEEARRYNYPIALMMVDLDHFKRINDHYGHQLGDRVLTTIAKIIEGSGRASDSAGRYGGEEFAVLLPHTDLDAAVILAERLRESVQQARIEGAEELIPSASFGVACIAEGDRETDMDILIQHADQALYQAKNEGRNQVRAWS